MTKLWKGQLNTGKTYKLTNQPLTPELGIVFPTRNVLIPEYVRPACALVQNFSPKNAGWAG